MKSLRAIQERLGSVRSGLEGWGSLRPAFANVSGLGAVRKQFGRTGWACEPEGLRVAETLPRS